MIILISNDDGIASEGLLSLKDSLQHLGEVWTVAPEKTQNAVGRALTLHRPLRVTALSDRKFMVNGTPSDCINLAINGILPEKPSLVVSGINKGTNLCDDISYSGTVAAAFEATILKIPAIAVSIPGNNGFIFGPAADFTAKLAETVLQNGLPSATFLNVNVPDTSGEKIRSCKITHQGKSIYSNTITKGVDPRGGKYYWIGGDGTSHMDIPGSDSDAVSRKYVSITPVSTDLTNYSAMNFLKNWGL